jgi:heme/copper-type cytochrome/quinol oxidase subunit 2
MARRQRRRRSWRTFLIVGGGVVVIGFAAILALGPMLDLGRSTPPPSGAQTVVISMAGFTPNRITVLAGRTVTLSIENPDSQFHTDGGGWHQFAIDALKLDVRVPPHTTKTVTLPALGKGRYEFYCDVCCGGRANPSMIGVLEVRG